MTKKKVMKAWAQDKSQKLNKRNGSLPQVVFQLSSEEVLTRDTAYPAPLVAQQLGGLYCVSHLCLISLGFLTVHTVVIFGNQQRLVVHFCGYIKVGSSLFCVVSKYEPKFILGYGQDE